MKDYAGKKYLEPRPVNTPRAWALTIAALIVCTAMILLPIWAHA